MTLCNVMFTFLFTSSLPAGFPQLPSGYSEWKRYPVNQSQDNEDADLPTITFTDLKKALWDIRVPVLKFDIAMANSRSGWARYSAQPTKDLSSVNKQGGTIQIEWMHHSNEELNTTGIKTVLISREASLIENMLALSNSGVEKISIAEHTAFRLRCWWWYSCCDDTYHDVGAVTGYYIPGSNRDWIIICVNLFYTYEESP